MDLDDDEEAVIRKAKALLAGTPPLQKENFENGTGCRDSMANGLTVDSIDDSAGGGGSTERSSIDVGNSNNQHTDFETMPRENIQVTERRKAPRAQGMVCAERLKMD